MTNAPHHALEAASHPDPYPWYRQLRESAPLRFDAAVNAWVASTAAVVQDAFASAQLRVRPPDEPVPRALAGTPAGTVFGHLVRMSDGAFHAAHKPAVAQAARRWADDAVGAAAASAARDLAERGDANAWLMAVPAQAVARLLGVPDAALDRTVLQVQRFTQGIAPGADAAAAAQAGEAAAALLADGTAQGLDAVAAANRIALMQQAVDATAGLLGNAVLAERQGLLPPTCWQDRALLAQAVAEVVRWDAPIHNTRRYAARECVLAGERIGPGQCVLLLLASASRDDALNARGDAFEVQRPARRTLVFGAGVHQCPGERLAIAIACGALAQLREQAGFESFFGGHEGYRPLANARIPVFGG